MRAVQVTQFGGPEVLVASDALDPNPGPEQAVVDVAAADILFLDTQLRSGWGAEYLNVQPPYVPGGGVAGVVRSVGASLDPSWTGQRVVAATGVSGGYAERALVPADALIPIPDGLNLRQAAALLQVGPAALSLLDAAELKPGQRTLVSAAAGGLGILLVQLAHAAGAQVFAAARGQRKLDLAREYGARAAIDYSEPGWTDGVREAAGGDPDVVFDGVGGELGRAAFAVTAHGGRFFGYGVPSGDFAEPDREEANRRGVSVAGIEQVQFSPDDFPRLAGQALAEAAAGRLRPVIGQTFPLERAADAHAAIEARSVAGKTLLLP